ncbi:transcription antitermination factor NusB [Mycoplasmopsis felifaucium]|uniref:transcription antitermination factor NusB n=1 Tax=Mycoplasmopsis felifaucium TaxID=35768 RepID=UPI000489E54F|nr:transcription antitermination factor NusB [Mycoplasmopsis felifaucium]
MKITRRQFRINIINVIYRYELMNEDIDINKIFEQNKKLSSEEIKQLEQITLNYKYYKSVIISFFKTNYEWTKVSPLIRAILINATHELFSIAPKVVINEAVEITKTYFEDENNLYKMVNAILQNIYKFLTLNELISRKNETKSQTS